MIAPGDHFQITFFQEVLSQQVINVYDYEAAGAASADAAGVAAAWWEFNKADWRNLQPNSSQFNSLIVRCDGTGGNLDTGEFAIPPAERSGLRGSIGDALASFNAVGCKFTVGTRVTRPGSKRWAVLGENDVAAQLLGGGVLALAEAFAAQLIVPFTYGTLAAGHGVLQVFGGPIQSNPVREVWNEVIGYLVDPYVTSQVSRKQGHGA